MVHEQLNSVLLVTLLTVPLLQEQSDLVSLGRQTFWVTCSTRGAERQQAQSVPLQAQPFWDVVRPAMVYCLP